MCAWLIISASQKSVWSSSLSASTLASLAALRHLQIGWAGFLCWVVIKVRPRLRANSVPSTRETTYLVTLTHKAWLWFNASHNCEFGLSPKTCQGSLLEALGGKSHFWSRRKGECDRRDAKAENLWPTDQAKVQLCWQWVGISSSRREHMPNVGWGWGIHGHNKVLQVMSTPIPEDWSGRLLTLWMCTCLLESPGFWLGLGTYCCDCV